MKLDRVIPFAHQLLGKAVSNGEIAIDATMGNGHDTVFLATLVGDNGKVFSFDIQKDALHATKEKLTSQKLQDIVSLHLCGHEHIMEIVPSTYHGKVSGAIFNLGYLPGGDKSIVTKAETTIAAIEQLLQILSKEGVIVLVIYHGHPEGAIERDKLIAYVENIDQQKAHVLRYQFINGINNPPFIIAIEKR
ncbi:class I SAM-dependent methyltransferase [Cytobacillus oceanisediminis]|uniref:rRNA methyltransferase n=1 Tax=Niallia alba TaxID=2729105 RepID=A0A7Y0PN92_9BACI|nr:MULTISPECIES: class I SAM-dependent methyltransferase [Bacillaceae]EOR23758.1 rRNA methylase [Niallia nealsonii AAU1]MBZ9536057.1 class I SAM-dependent methyltransferase [Cytobacillus oceanisediminis]NMO78872.1 rRNA methyltransferase [Niallia alba]